jgi:transcriptional regulator with XRE-family HTH domain
MMSAMATTTDETTRQLNLLAALVRQRRLALGLSSQDKAAEVCGLSHMTYRHVENGRTVSASTYAKIETRFGILAGSCQAVANGADSLKLEDGSELFADAQSRPAMDGLADELKSAITSAASLTAPELTLRQTQEMTDKVVEELRRRGYLPKKP